MSTHPARPLSSTQELSAADAIHARVYELQRPTALVVRDALLVVLAWEEMPQSIREAPEWTWLHIRMGRLAESVRRLEEEKI
jgi:hypothetical protein